MIIEFDKYSYVEITRTSSDGKIKITLAAKDTKNPKSQIVNSVEVTRDEFKEMAKEVLG
jgi:hypothetical protein